MKKQREKSIKGIPIFNHLEQIVKYTTYEQRLDWLQNVNDLARFLENRELSKKPR